MVESANDWAFAQEPLRFRSWSVDCLVDAQLEFSGAVKLLVKIYITITAAGILNLGPAQLNAALVGQDHRGFGIALGACGNVASHKRLRVVEQHARWFTGLLVSQNLSAKRVFGVFRNAADFQSRAVRHRAMSVGAP